jgi:O-antigen/teichoic acid export membrane protein
MFSKTTNPYISRLINWFEYTRIGKTILGCLYGFWSETVSKFMKNIGMVFLFNRLGSLFTMVITIWAARSLGPAEYGNIGIITNISNLLMLLVMLGVNNAMYKYIPGSPERENDQLKAAALTGNFISALCFSGLYFQIGGWVETFFRIPVRIWQIGITATIILNFYILSESFIRGRKLFSTIARVRFIGSLLFFLIFLMGVYYFQNFNIHSYFYAFFISQLFFVVIAMAKSGFRSFSLSWRVFHKIYQYGFWNMANSLIIIILYSSDLFFINFFFPGREVGIYNVYQGFAKGLFSVLFYEVFAVVFLPTIAHMDKSRLYQLFRRIVPVAFPLIIALVSCFIAVVVWLTGKEYGLNWGYILLSAAGIAFYSIFHVYNAIFTMEGNRGAKLCLIPLGIILPLSLISQYYFTRYFGITGTMVAVLLTNMLLAVFFDILMKRNLTGKFSPANP